MTDDRKEPILSPLKPDQEDIARHRQRTANATQRASANGGRANTGNHRPVVVRSKLAPFAFLLAVTGLGLAGFSYWQLLEAEKATEAALVRIADLEGRLELTGDETQASAAAMQAKLKWADSEIRKLWGVAYDTNRKDIAENTATIAAVRKQSDTSLKEIRGDVNRVNDLVGAQQSTFKKVEQSRLQLQQQSQQVADALNEVRETQAELQNRVNTTEQAIEAIDKFRLSVNRDLLELKSRGSTP